MGQLGFDDLLADAAKDNAKRQFVAETAHLPDDWPEAVTCHNDQIAQHHAAMLACDFDLALAIRKDAHLLAKKLNGGALGILSSEDAPGCRLAKACAAPEGKVPLWGQDGTFTLDLDGMTTLIEMGGMFGIGATAMPYLGFSVRAVDRRKPFLSNTGYRSFLGATVPAELNMTVADFVRKVVTYHVTEELGTSY